eukprot:TRINITY_DN94_c0_g1_i2.p2 TRINITY_DN94_c0_g1~~TRINITY_DN94_c0_g1_i2.p2  ORF type:complete len:145 (+),score=21.50 TRINITY_DN94_c0_g1_i2:445-879(+)
MQLLVLVLSLVVFVASQQCTNYNSCHDCLQDPDCGWCAFTQTNTGRCVLGNNYGPYSGTCNSWNKTWYYNSCSSTPSYNPYPTPSYNPYPTPSYNPYPTPSSPSFTLSLYSYTNTYSNCTYTYETCGVYNTFNFSDPLPSNYFP